MRRLSSILLPGILCATALAGVAATGTADGAYQPGTLARALQPFVDDHTIGGAVTPVANKDGILAQETVGYANVEKQTPMPKDAMFAIASETKSFTTVALMMMVDQGKVNLDDPVSKYLPEFAGQQVVEKQADGILSAPRDPSSPLLVRELLNHTSGLQQDRAFGGRPDYRLKDYVRLIAKEPLQHDPGTHYEYNNSNFETAGRILEVVSGVPYEEFLTDNIIRPLGLTNTTFWPDAAQQARLATAYAYSPDAPGYKEIPARSVRYNVPPDQRTANPAGDLVSDVQDMSRFARMLLNGGEFYGHRYITAADIRLMGSTQIKGITGREEGYGYGMFTMRTDHGETGVVAPGMFGHEGALATDFEVDPQDRLVFILMVQQAGFGKTKGFATIDRPFWNASIAAFGPTRAGK